MVGEKINVSIKVMFLHTLPMLFGLIYLVFINIKTSEEIKYIYDSMKEAPFDGC